MKTKDIKEFETDITVHLTRISGDVEYTKQRVDLVVKHLEFMNGRYIYIQENSGYYKWITFERGYFDLF